MRSFWKGPVPFIISSNKKEQMKIVSRNTTIFPCFVGKTFLVKNGKSSLKKIQISIEMVGFKIGEFILTKKVY
jgi:small subunit ribosomal protein S19